MRMLLLLICLLFITQHTWAQSPPQFSIVKDISSGSQSSNPYQVVYCNGKIFFVAVVPGIDQEVWVTDGTSAGTVLTRDVGSLSSGGITELTVLNENVFFVHGNSEKGRELYITNGTYTGTGLVKDIIPGANGSEPLELTVYNGKLYFTAMAVNYGRELWVTDGTDAGTSIVKELWPGNQLDGPRGLRVALGKLFFTSMVSGQRHLYVSDGSASGTVKLKDFDQSPGYGPMHFTEMNGKVYFSAFDAIHGRELWVSDGTEAGTKLVKDINAGTSDSHKLGGATGFQIIAHNGTLFFNADGGNGTGEGLWKSDGTAGGTIELNASASPYTTGFYTFDNKVWFTTPQGTVWMSDGTPSGTRELKTEVNNKLKSSLYEFYGKLYFAAESNHPARSGYGNQLWQSDGTDAGTNMLLPGSLHTTGEIIGREFVNIGSDLFFAAAYTGSADGNELWKMSLFPTSVNDEITTTPQYLYPNPTTGTIHIKLPQVKDASVKIYSLTGQLMRLENITDVLTTIDVSTFAPGMYITHITNGAATTIEKLMKE